MAAPTLAVPMVGGPGDGQTAQVRPEPDGRPPATHTYEAPGGTGRYMLESTGADGSGWQYRILTAAELESNDFATEHGSPTFADQMPGGPERVPEDDSPQGLAGAD